MSGQTQDWHELVALLHQAAEDVARADNGVTRANTESRLARERFATLRGDLTRLAVPYIDFSVLYSMVRVARDGYRIVQSPLDE